MAIPTTRAPFYYDSRRGPKTTILVRMTPEEAALAPEALRHVAGGVFEDSPKQQERLRDLAQAIESAAGA